MALFHQTDRLEMAARFINSTNSHLFLTGKAADKMEFEDESMRKAMGILLKRFSKIT